MYTFEDFAHQKLAVKFEVSGSDTYMEFVIYLTQKGMRWGCGQNLTDVIYRQGEPIYLAPDYSPREVYYCESATGWIHDKNYLIVLPEEFDFMSKHEAEPLSLIQTFIYGA